MASLAAAAIGDALFQPQGHEQRQVVELLEQRADVPIMPTTVRSECTKVSSGMATKVSANGRMKPIPICAAVVIQR